MDPIGEVLENVEMTVNVVLRKPNEAFPAIPLWFLSSTESKILVNLDLVQGIDAMFKELGVRRAMQPKGAHLQVRQTKRRTQPKVGSVLVACIA